MPKVLVYRYRCYDVTKDDYMYSTRMATADKIAQIQCEPIRGSDILVDSALLTEGWTDKNFDLHRAGD
jgi:hypothetical protein